MIRRCYLTLLACLLGCLPGLLLATEVQASLDRNQVALGETVTLNLQVEGSGVSGPPDLSALQSDFDVLGSSSNTSVSIVNGQRHDEFGFGIALRPKHTGSLVIPSIALAGGHSQPLKLEVTAAAQAAAATADRAQFMESALEPGRAYVGQQLLYTVRLFFSSDLSGGNMEVPHADGADVRRLGDKIDYEAERNGRRYHVVEWRYAIIPQRAGPLRVAPLSFQGEAVDPNDPDSFFAASRPITLSAPARQVEVSEPPPGNDKAAWLPARQLSLGMSGLPADGQARVNQPINLQMSVQAVGLPPESLPQLTLPNLDGATVYPGKPAQSSRSDGRWLNSSRQQSYALVPSRPGRLHLPAITLNWWNVQTDRAETATIPARDFTVLPAAGTVAPAASATALPAPASTVSTAASSGTQASSSEPRGGVGGPLWQWIAIGSLLLWLVSMLLWLWFRRRPVRPTSATVENARPAAGPRGSRQAFLDACGVSDPTRQAAALLEWARTERPNLPLRQLGDLTAALADENQRVAIATLQRSIYGGGVGDQLNPRAAFEQGFAWSDQKPDDGDDSPLPPLYPFKLR